MGTCKSVATTSAEPVVGVARGEEGGACAARRYRKVSPLDDSHRFDLQSPLFGSHDRSGGILGTSSSLASGQSHPLATTSSRGTASRVSASIQAWRAEHSGQEDGAHLLLGGGTPPRSLLRKDCVSPLRHPSPSPGGPASNSSFCSGHKTSATPCNRVRLCRQALQFLDSEEEEDTSTLNLGSSHHLRRWLDGQTEHVGGSGTLACLPSNTRQAK